MNIRFAAIDTASGDNRQNHRNKQQRAGRRGQQSDIDRLGRHSALAGATSEVAMATSKIAPYIRRPRAIGSSANSKLRCRSLGWCSRVATSSVGTQRPLRLIFISQSPQPHRPRRQDADRQHHAGQNRMPQI